MKKWLIGGFLTLVSATASAGCPQSSMGGTWNFFMNIADSGTISWQSCSVVVDKKGVFGTGSTCVSNLGTSANVDSGNLTTDNPTCGLTGEITIGGNTLTFSDGQVTNDKKVMTGVGGSTTGIMTFTAIKQ